MSEGFADGLVSAQAMEHASSAAGAFYEAEVARNESGGETVDARLACAASYVASGFIDVAVLASILHIAAGCSSVGRDGEHAAQTAIVRDIFGNPFRPVRFSPTWRTDTTVSLARQMYESRDFGAMPVLADALQDAGCDRADVLDHCRGEGPHVRGCWVVDWVLGKE